MILLPDTEQQAIYEADIAPEPQPTATRCSSPTASTSASAASCRPTGVDVAMVAPKGPGHLVRRTYDEGGGVPCLIAVRAGRHRQGARRWRWPTPTPSAAPGPACSRPPSRRRPRPTSSASRSCCAAASPRSCRPGFETLVEAGYQPESAYFECLHELKLIVDLMYEQGIARHALLHLRHRRVRRPHPRARASSTTPSRPRCARSSARSSPASSPRSGSPRARPGGANFHALEAKGKEHPIEQVGARAAGDDAVDRRGQDQGAGRLRGRLTLAAQLATVVEVVVVVVGGTGAASRGSSHLASEPTPRRSA